MQDVQVDLKDDRFDITYDPQQATVDGILTSIRKLDFEPVVVERKAHSRATTQVDVGQLPADLRDLFAEAGRSQKPVLIRFSGPG